MMALHWRIPFRLAVVSILAGLLMMAVPQTAQAEGELVWVRDWGNVFQETTTDAVLDGADNVYVVGSFPGSVDFNPGPGVAVLTATGSRAGYMVKLTPSGQFLWARAIGSTEAVVINGAATDSGGNLYVTGNFTGIIDLDPSAGTVNYTSRGDRDIFVAKYDVFGNFLWGFGTGSDQSDTGEAVVLDGGDNVFVTGSFEEVVDFDPAPNKSVRESEGDDDIFVARYSADGAFITAWSMGGDDDDVGYDIAADDQGNVYIAGLFEGTVDLYPGDLKDERTSKGDEDIFVVMFDGGGQWRWSNVIGGLEDDGRPALVVDSFENVFVTGNFESTAAFGRGPERIEVTTIGDEDIFLARLDIFGNFLWAYGFGDGRSDGGVDITLDRYENLYVTGNFEGVVDFDPGAGVATLASAGEDDAFVAKYRRSGALVWAKGLRGSENVEGHAVAVGRQGDIYVAGAYNGAVDFDPDVGVDNRTAAGQADAFVVRLDRLRLDAARIYLPAVSVAQVTQ